MFNRIHSKWIDYSILFFSSFLIIKTLCNIKIMKKLWFVINIRFNNILRVRCPSTFVILFPLWMHYHLKNNDLVRWLQLSKFLSMSSPKCNSTTTWVQPITNDFNVFKSLLIRPWRDLKNYVYLRKIFTKTITIRDKKSMCSLYMNLF